jgi:hypothetical protein
MEWRIRQMEIQNETLVVLEEGTSLDVEAPLGCCFAAVTVTF